MLGIPYTKPTCGLFLRNSQIHSGLYRVAPAIKNAVSKDHPEYLPMSLFIRTKYFIEKKYEGVDINVHQ